MAACLTLIASGCAGLENNVLFMTKTNVGIDIDSKPPTAEISIARREAVLEPTFKGGQTPTVMASFRSSATGLLGMFYDISATFAGGDAATTMTRLYGDKTAGLEGIEPSYMCLPENPSKAQGSQEYRPFVFGTDTSFGLKIAWSGLTAHIPDTFRLGYNRKELAWAPISVTEEDCDPKDGRAKTTWKATVNSFLATIDHGGQAGSMKESGYEHIQYFATGKAATYLSLRQEVRQAMLRKVDPELLAAREYRCEANCACIDNWIKVDETTNLPKVKAWLKSKNFNVRVTDFVNAAEYVDQRRSAISELSITCP